MVKGPIEKIIIQAPKGIKFGDEFSHIITLADIKLEQKPIHLNADEQQCKALALRFDLPQIHTLSANVQLRDNPIHISGTVEAIIDQFCAATGATITAIIKENIAINFIETPDNSEEMALEDEDCETMFHNGRDIDIGEAIAQSLYLALDPFPRAENADQILADIGVKSEEDMVEISHEQSPFNALSSLKKT